MRRVVLIAALVVLALAACGGDDGDSGSGGNGNGGNGGGTAADTPDVSGDVDVCELLTTDEVEAAIGNEVNDARPDIANSCVWGTDDPEQRSVSVHLLIGPSQDQCVSALEGDADLTETDQFGVPAFTSFNPAVGGLADVVACTDQGQLQVIANGGVSETGNEAELRSAADELAQQALDRL
ncbi:MAG TPA: hypothetical protein VF152_06615 [Acidimicrobiia bacterium]